MILPWRASVVYNSAFPFGENDGAIWAGRGFTGAFEFGFSHSFGHVRTTVAPLMFWSQNARFSLGPNGQSGTRRFADWSDPTTIDTPQRFGDQSYARLDPGQSGIQFVAKGAALGITSANEIWGPAYDHPLILGNNAPGFWHAFVGSQPPLDFWKLGRVHGRVFWGRTQQSAYSPLSDTSVSLLASGIVAVFQPTLFPGLEVGGGRFFHVLQPRFLIDGRELLRPVGAILKVGRARQLGTESGDEPAENQLASVFARLAFPDDALEVYGEYGREDANWDMRELLAFPDHDAAYTIGLRKGFERDGTSLTSVRVEILNSRITHLALSSNQAPWYVHGAVAAGHTNDGQPLGSAAAHGGGGAVLALDRYTPRGRTTVRWERISLGQSRSDSVPNLFSNDIAHAWSVNSLRFGRRADIEWSLTTIYEQNRYLQHDALSVRVTIAVSESTLRQGQAR